MNKNPDLDFTELKLPVIELPHFEMMHYELLDTENLLEYELEYLLMGD